MIPALNISHLAKVYKNQTIALKDASLQIEKGDFFGLIGANGAGKSTLIGVLTGLVIKTAGKVEIFGVDIDHQPDLARSMIGVVPQEFNFNVFENIQNILINQAGYYGVLRSVAKKRSQELLEQLDLWDKRKEEARRLSGGMKRRLMIARALMSSPKLLLLDEPTVGVDIAMRQSTWDYLRELNRSGMTILLTSHYLEEIEELCHRAAIIQKGHILKSDTVNNLVESVDNQVYIARLNHLNGIEKIKGYEIHLIDESTLEVILQSQDTLTDFVSVISEAGMAIKDIRPKRNRLEQLFFNLNTPFQDES